MTLARRPSSRTALIALALATAGLSVTAQDRPVYRSTAEIARVEVAVFGPDGGPATDLTVHDFVLLEDGVERPIPVFLAPNDQPMELALAIDTSGSMRLWPTREAALALLESLNPRSCVLVLPFKESALSSRWGHPGDPALRAFVEGLELSSDEAIYDAIVAAFHQLRAWQLGSTRQGFDLESDTFPYRSDGLEAVAEIEPPAGECSIPFAPWTTAESAANVRRAVIVLTDGQDHESTVTLDDVLTTAWGSGIPLYALAILPLSRAGDINMVGRPTNLAMLRGMGRIAEHTGGFVIRGGGYRSGSDRAFLDDVARLQAALQGLYTLGYVPAPSEKGSQIIERRKIEVEVNRDDVEIITTENLALGRGRSAGAALHLARQGMRRLANGDVSGALERFDGATSLGPEVGMGWFGRGLALIELDRSDEAIDSLRRAAEHAPWIPDVHAHLAWLYLDEGDTDAAWESAIKAYDNGSDVLDLIDDLQAVDPRPFDPGRIPEHPRVELRIGGDSNLLGAVTAPALAAVLANELNASDRVDYGAAGDRALILEVDISDAEQRGPRVELEGWLVLTRSDGDGLLEQRFRIRNANDREELATLAREFVARIEAVVEERRRD